MLAQTELAARAPAQLRAALRDSSLSPDEKTRAVTAFLLASSPEFARLEERRQVLGAACESIAEVRKAAAAVEDSLFGAPSPGPAGAPPPVSLEAASDRHNQLVDDSLRRADGSLTAADWVGMRAPIAEEGASLTIHDVAESLASRLRQVTTSQTNAVFALQQALRQ